MRRKRSVYSSADSMPAVAPALAGTPIPTLTTLSFDLTEVRLVGRLLLRLLDMLFKLMDEVEAEVLLLLRLEDTREDDRVGLLLSLPVLLFETDFFGKTMVNQVDVMTSQLTFNNGINGLVVK